MISNDLDRESMEHPEVVQTDAHLDRLLLATDLEEPWFKSIARSIRERLHPQKLPPLVLTSRPVEDTSFGDLSKVEQPWFKSLIGNVKDIISPPKLPPLEVTSKPVEVGSIWGAYGGGETRSGAVSIGVHVGVVLLLLFVFQSTPAKNLMKKITD